MTFKVLMVCMGNICRSPMAQVVGQHKANDSARSNPSARPLVFSSAGTHAHHVGEPPDARALTVLQRRGYRSDKKLRSRRVRESDFSDYDLILAMDLSNQRALLRICPAHHQHKVRLLLDFAQGGSEQEVPDPYYGNEAGFERVLDLCEAGVQGLINQLHATAQA